MLYKKGKKRQERVWLLASGFYSGSTGKTAIAVAYLTDRELLATRGVPFDIGRHPSMDACTKTKGDPGEARTAYAAYMAGAEYAALFGLRKVTVWDGSDAHVRDIKTPPLAKVRIVHEAAPGEALESTIQAVMDALDQAAADKAMDPAPLDGSVEVKTLEGGERDADP